MDPIRVLLIGGNPALFDLVKLFLEQHQGVVVVGVCIEATSGLVQAARLQPQVVICDLGTPGLTGLDTISRLHTMMPEVGIVATTLLRATGYQQVARMAGADEVVVEAELGRRLLPVVLQVAEKPRSRDGATVR
jgi:two-component system secretion response regulator SsrB